MDPSETTCKLAEGRRDSQNEVGTPPDKWDDTSQTSSHTHLETEFYNFALANNTPCLYTELKSNHMSISSWDSTSQSSDKTTESKPEERDDSKEKVSDELQLGLTGALAVQRSQLDDCPMEYTDATQSSQHTFSSQKYQQAQSDINGTTFQSECVSSWEEPACFEKIMHREPRSDQCKELDLILDSIEFTSDTGDSVEDIDTDHTPNTARNHNHSSDLHLENISKIELLLCDVCECQSNKNIGGFTETSACYDSHRLDDSETMETGYRSAVNCTIPTAVQKCHSSKSLSVILESTTQPTKCCKSVNQHHSFHSISDCSTVSSISCKSVSANRNTSQITVIKVAALNLYSGEEGDTAYNVKSHKSVKLVDNSTFLKQFINPVTPLEMAPESDTTSPYHRVYQCNIVEVPSMTDDDETSAPSPASQIVPTSNDANAIATGGSLVSSDISTANMQQLSETVPAGAFGGARPKRRGSFMQKLRTDREPSSKMYVATPKTQTAETWLYMDADGNTEEVTQRDVTFLLGGRSADSVVAESTAHPISTAAMERSTRSQSAGLAAPLEPIIQESLLLLRKADSGGEQSQHRNLKLERKRGDVLLYISRPTSGVDMNTAPSVRFINLDNEMVQLWRRSQDFRRSDQSANMMTIGALSTQQGIGLFQSVSLEESETSNEPLEAVSSLLSRRRGSETPVTYSIGNSVPENLPLVTNQTSNGQADSPRSSQTSIPVNNTASDTSSAAETGADAEYTSPSEDNEPKDTIPESLSQTAVKVDAYLTYNLQLPDIHPLGSTKSKLENKATSHEVSDVASGKKKDKLSFLRKFHKKRLANPPTVIPSASSSTQTPGEADASDKLELEKNAENSAEICALQDEAARFRDLAEQNKRMLEEERERACDLELQLKISIQKERALIAEKLLNNASNAVESHSGCSTVKEFTDLKTYEQVDEEKRQQEIFEEVQQLKCQLIESENSVKDSIINYIVNKQFGMELLNTVKSYSNLQQKVEQKYNTLAQDLIKQQAETLIKQRQTSEAKIKSLETQLKILEDENIQLLKKFEKLRVRVKQHTGTLSAGKESAEESYLRLCDKLRSMLGVSDSELTHTKKVLQDAQAKVDTLDAEVKNLKIELKNEIILKNRLITTHKVEMAKLKEERSSKTVVLHDSVEAADVILEDLESLRKSLSEAGIEVHINWSRLQAGKNTLADFLHICRGCVNELGKAALNCHNQLKLVSKELTDLKDTNFKLEKELQGTRGEKNMLSKHCEDLGFKNEQFIKEIKELEGINISLQEHLSVATSSNTVLQEEITQLQDKQQTAENQENLDEKLEKAVEWAMQSTIVLTLQKQVKDMTAEKFSILEKLHQSEKLVEKLQLWISKNEEELSAAEAQNKQKILELTTRVEQLSKEVDQLHSLQQNTAEHSNQFEEMQPNYFKLFAEKTYLSDELNMLKSDNKTLKESQETYLSQIILLQNDLKNMLEEKSSLKAELTQSLNVIKEYEKIQYIGQVEAQYSSQTLSNAENQMRSLQESMGEKLLKAKELENMLEQNRNIIKDLKNTLEQKEAVIVKLESSLLQLNTVANVHHQGASALSEENRQLRQSIESLCKNYEHDKSTTLAKLNELQSSLDDTRQQLVETKHVLKDKESQLSKLKEELIQETNRPEEVTLITEGLKDLTNLVLQRDKLIENQQEFINEIERLYSCIKKKQRKNDSLIKQNQEQASSIKNLEGKLEHATRDLKSSHENTEATVLSATELKLKLKTAKEQIWEYERHIAQIGNEMTKQISEKQATIEALLQEKTDLQNTVTQKSDMLAKLKQDFEVSLTKLETMACNEKNLQQTLTDELKQRNIAEHKITDILEEKEIILKKAAALEEQVRYAKEAARSLKSECIAFQESFFERERNMKQCLTEKSKQISDLEQQLADAYGVNDQLRKDFDVLTHDVLQAEKYSQIMEKSSYAHGKTLHELELHKREIQDLNNQLRVLEGEKAQIKEQAEMEDKDHQLTIKDLKFLNQELDKDKQRLEESFHVIQDRCLEYESKIDNLQKQVSTLEKQKYDFKSDKTEAERSTVELMKQKELLQAEHEDLTQKLFQAIHLICDEKTKKEQVESKTNELTAYITQLEAEKKNKDHKIKKLTEDVSEMQENLQQMSTDKERINGDIKILQNTKENLEQTACELKCKLKQVQKQLDLTKKKYQEEKAGMLEFMSSKSEEISEKNNEIQKLERKIERLSEELFEARQKMLTNNQDQANFERTIYSLQVERGEISVKCHELECKLQAETQVRIQLQQTIQNLLEQVEKLNMHLPRCD